MSSSSWLIWDPQWLSGSTLTPDPRNTTWAQHRKSEQWQCVKVMLFLFWIWWAQSLQYALFNFRCLDPSVPETYLWWACQSRGQWGTDTCSSGCVGRGVWPPSGSAGPLASSVSSCQDSPAGHERRPWRSPVMTEGTAAGWRSPSAGSVSQTDPALMNPGTPEWIETKDKNQPWCEEQKCNYRFFLSIFRNVSCVFVIYDGLNLQLWWLYELWRKKLQI